MNVYALFVTTIFVGWFNTLVIENDGLVNGGMSSS
jgi:hypothetical protein